MIKISVVKRSVAIRDVNILLTFNKNMRGALDELDTFFLSANLQPEKTRHELYVYKGAREIRHTMQGDMTKVFCTLSVCIFKTITDERIKNILYSCLDKAVKGFIMDMAIKGRLNTKQEDL